MPFIALKCAKMNNYGGGNCRCISLDLEISRVETSNLAMPKLYASSPDNVIFPFIFITDIT